MRVNMCGFLFFLFCGLGLISNAVALLAAMSVDFGSQFMKIALVKPGVPMEIVLNTEARRKTPNSIGLKGDERFFGDDALSFGMKNAKNSFPHLVNLLGKNVDNPIVSLYQKRFPFVKIISDENRGTVLFSVDDEKYSVETLIAMLLTHAQKLSEKYAEQPVKDVVIAVPAFFNQAERRAMTKAAEIAGLNLLQILNDHSAAGLNYGIFRRKEITEQAQTLLIYDMGASKTTASVLEYRLEKEKKSNEKNPVMSTLGYGYDRTLGGFEISLRMRDHLIREFKNQKKTTQDLTANPRAMAKMLKEAERIKQILSANPDHIAQVESVHEDQDFQARVSRDQLEEMVKDLEPRMIKPIDDALKMAEMNVDQIDQVVLMGAATRMPKVQEIIRNYFKGKELSKVLNTDESIAMGAVYQAARLSKGFKVKRFDVRDLQIFPIQVDFHSQSKKDGTLSDRVVHRPIFGYKTYFPSTKKILSFSSFTKDFTFNVNYGELKHLSEKQLSEFGSTNITDVDLEGITKAYESEMIDEKAVYKGVKAHFSIDESGIVSIDGAELYVEKLPKEESAFASLAGKITGLFSSGNAAKTAEDGEEKDRKPEAKEDEIKEKKEASKTNEGNDKIPETEDANSKNETSNKGEKFAEEKKNNETETAKKDDNKPKMTKIPLVVKERRLDIDMLSDSETQSAKKKLAKFAQIERKKAEREEAHNTLESLVYDVSDKLQQEELQRFIKPEEREELEKEIGRIRLWLEDDVGIDTTTEEFKSNRKAVDQLLKPIVFRINEYNARPAMVADLISLFNHSEIFVTLGRNLTETGIFTAVEISTLEGVLNETKIWWAEKNATQMALKPIDEPAYTVEDLKEKIRDLDREVRYLVNKMKYTKPKVKVEKTNDTETTSENETVAEETVKSESEKDIGAKENQPPASEETGKEEELLKLEDKDETCKEGSCKEKDVNHDATEL